jgi:hypothetical protein
MTDKPVKAGRNQAGRWEKGTSGNRSGKPQGARRHAVVALEQLMRDGAQAVTLAVIKAAQAGDTAAARIILDRVAPARKDSPVVIKLPVMTDAIGLLAAGNCVLAAVAIGEITPGEGDALMSLLGRQRQFLDTADLERRVAALEQGGEP